MGVSPIDPYNRTLEEGDSGTDIRNRFTSNVIYSPAWGNGSSCMLVRQAVAGWSLATTFTAQSGSHYTGMMSGASPPAVCFSNTTNLQVLSSTCTSANILSGADTAYSPIDGSMGGAGISSPGSAAAGRFAGAPRGSYVLPSLYDLDLRLSKQWSVKERYHIELRGEAFNALNSTLVQVANNTQYSYAAAGSTSTSCPASAHGTNTCLIPVSTFGKASTTSGTLLGARQMQAAIRFEF